MIHGSDCKLSPGTDKDGDLVAMLESTHAELLQVKNDELEFRRQLHSSGFVIHCHLHRFVGNKNKINQQYFDTNPAVTSNKRSD